MHMQRALDSPQVLPSPIADKRSPIHARSPGGLREERVMERGLVGFSEVEKYAGGQARHRHQNETL